MNINTCTLPSRRAVSFALALGLAAFGSQFAVAQTSSSSNSSNDMSSNSNSSNNSNNTISNGSSNSDNSKLSHSDRHFLEKAAKSGMEEVDLGQLGSEHSGDPRVKAFADQMVRDHTQANQELEALAARKGVTLPQKDKVPNSHTYKSLSDRSGADFDQHFMNKMVDDHHEAVELFEKATKSNDPDIAAFASKYLPILQHHEQMAQDLQNSLKQR